MLGSNTPPRLSTSSTYDTETEVPPYTGGVHAKVYSYRSDTEPAFGIVQL